jgi:hypothetical protein
MKFSQLCILVAVTTAIVGCDTGLESPRGFSLPEGDVTEGGKVFLNYQCLSCHELKGLEQPDILDNPALSIPLGGKTDKVKTYAELVTAIINPSHTIAKGYPKSLVQTDSVSKMTNYNSVMTVTELVDLVVFLQPYYKLVPYTRTQYSPYIYEE